MTLRFYSVTAALVFALDASAQTPPLERLFFSKPERAQLDASRNAPKPLPPAPQVTKPVVPVMPVDKEPDSVILSAPREEKKTPSPPRRQVLTGFVERSSGTNTIWMNNQAQAIEGGYGELDPLDVGKARQK